MNKTLQNTNPFHPEVFNTYLKKQAPSKDEAIKSIIKIVALDLGDCEWTVYAGMIMAYLNGSSIKGIESEDEETLEEAVNGDDLNGHLKYDAVRSFLETHTSTYRPSEQEIRDANQRAIEDDNQRAAYFGGQG
jgi:hypothetical protein